MREERKALRSRIGRNYVKPNRGWAYVFEEDNEKTEKDDLQ